MMAAVLLYSFLPSSVLPIPPVFLLIVLAGALLSLLSAIIAGLRGSRAWFLAVVPPIAFFFILLNFEQSTEVKITGTSDNVTFVLSGSGTLTEFIVFSPEYPTAAEKPNDAKLALWRIAPTDNEGWGEPVWRIHSIRYGIVPKGYVQSIPLQGQPEPLRESERPYYVSVTTASAAGTAGYFTVVGGKPEWAKNPPDGPCFTRRDSKDIRVPCLH